MKKRIIVRALTKEGVNEFAERDVELDTIEVIEVNSIEEGVIIANEKDMYQEGKIVEQVYDEKRFHWDDMVIHFTCEGEIYSSIDADKW